MEEVVRGGDSIHLFDVSGGERVLKQCLKK